MIKITDRDKQIKDFLKEVVVADTKTISILFFNRSLRATQQRLKLLCDYKYIKSFRENILCQNIYYINKRPSSYKHKIVFSQLLARLKDMNIEVLKYKTPLKLGAIIADGFFAAKINGVVKLYLVEVEISKYFDVKKYIDLYNTKSYKEKFPVMPGILVITNKKVKTDKDLDTKISDLELNNLKL